MGLYGTCIHLNIGMGTSKVELLTRATGALRLISGTARTFSLFICLFLLSY